MSLKYRAVKKITRKVKERILQEIESYLKSYRFLIVADLFKIGSSEIQQIRKLLRRKAVIKVTRNRLLEKAIEKVFGSKKFSLSGQNMFIFTNMNPYELYIFLSKNKIPIPAQAGAIAPKDIIVPEGNTGLTPGPVLSKFSKLKVPTKIVEGSVWIAKDTVIAKAGEQISNDAVELLNLLGIKPLELTINLRMAFDGRTVLENISLNLEEITNEIKKAYEDGFRLALNAKLPLPEVLPLLIYEAYQNYLKILDSVVVPERESLERSLKKAESIAKLVQEKIKDKF